MNDSSLANVRTLTPALTDRLTRWRDDARDIQKQMAELDKESMQLQAEATKLQEKVRLNRANRARLYQERDAIRTALRRIEDSEE